MLIKTFFKSFFDSILNMADYTMDGSQAVKYTTIDNRKTMLSGLKILAIPNIIPTIMFLRLSNFEPFKSMSIAIKVKKVKICWLVKTPVYVIA
mgnify:CR=1 FL=1